MEYLIFTCEPAVSFLSAGKFISSSEWTHMNRTIDSYEILIGVKGNIYLQEGATKYTLHPGDILLLYPGLNHFGYKNSNTGDSFYWLHFIVQSDFEILSQEDFKPAMTLMKNNPFIRMNEDKIILPKFLSDVNSDRITVLIHQLLHVYKSPYYTKKMADFITSSLLIEITNEYMLKMNEDAVENLNSKMSKILNWIKINSHTNFRIEKMADELSYNKDYLSRYFKKNMGMSIKDYLVFLRLNLAKKYIFETNLTIKEIAYKVGFNDYNYFIKVFKKQEGITPAHFRNTYFNLNYNNI